MGSTTQFGKYQLIKKLATGGMAEVFLARQSMGSGDDSRHVVVKRILPHMAEDPDFIQMFQNEARVAAKFSHPNIAQIFDYGEEGGTWFIAMEFIHGEDLGRVIRKAWNTGQWVAHPLAIRMIASACEGLHYAHTRKDEQGRPLQVVHRDISPQNILVSFDGSVKVVDFGIAKAANMSSMTKSGAIKGKFAYMAPEQANTEEVDARTDIFALGLVLYELLTGVRPLKRESELGTLQAAMACEILPPSEVAEIPAEIDGVVMRALARNPNDRYKDARAFQIALDEYLALRRLVASSVQISELMETLFADRRAEEQRLGAPNPSAVDSKTEPPTMPEAAVVPPPPGWTAAAPRVWQAPPQVPAMAELTDPAVPPPPVLPSRKYVEPATEPATPLAPVLPSRKYSQQPQRGELGVPRPPRKNSTETAPAITRTPTPPSVPVAPLVPRPSKPTLVRAPPKAPEVERPNWAARVLVIVGVVGLVAGGGALAKLAWPAPSANGLLLTVNSEPRMNVVVIPKDPQRARVELGDTPFRRMAGAEYGDLIVLESPTLCARSEHSFPFGEPSEEKTIDQDFVVGRLKLNLTPANVAGLAVFCNDVDRGALPSIVDLYQGKHRLEIRGDALKAPVPIEVEIAPGQMTTKAVDLRPHLAK